MFMSVPNPARLSRLPDDVLRALATFVPLSDLLVLVRCSRHFQTVLQSQLRRCLDRLFVVTHDEEHCYRARHMPYSYLPNQPEQRVLNSLFGEGKMRGDLRAYCFTDGQSILSLTQRKLMDIFGEYAPACYIILGTNTRTHDRFMGWLRYRYEQHLATEAHASGTTTDAMGGVTGDV
jgi:hypothetical protein